MACFFLFFVTVNIIWADESQKVIHVYPSAHLPPVSDPYYFYWDFGGGPLGTGVAANMQGVSNDQGYQTQLAIGKLPVRWLYGPQRPNSKSASDSAAYYINSIHAGRAYLIDEWQNPRIDFLPGTPLSPLDPFGLTGAVTGIRQAKTTSPDSFIVVAWRGESSLKPLVDSGSVDLIAVEAYMNMPTRFPAFWGVNLDQVKQRIDIARSWGMIDRTIPWLGHIVAYDKYYSAMRLDVAGLENQIRTLRQYAPEMPGLAFYGASNPELVKAADELSRKYFRDPAPRIQIEEPAPFERLDRSLHIFKCSAYGLDGRTIMSYEGFVDSRLVYTGTDPVFSWDFSVDAPGTHYITFHAIDSNWNRAAAQVEISVD